MNPSRAAYGMRAALLGWALCLPAPAAAARTVVSLTFDDGVSDQPRARQILDQRGVKGTFYVNSAELGASDYYMTLSEVQAIAASGHEIGGHSLNHLDMTTLSAEELRRQICDDRARLLAWGLAPTSFSYPFGNHDAAAEAMAQSCGYSSARSVGELQCSGCPRSESIPPADAFALRAPESMHSDTSLATMQRYVTDVEQSGGGWLMIVMHHLCDGCDMYATSAATLSGFVDWLQARAGQGTVIQTVGEVMGGQEPGNPYPTITGLSPAAALAGTPGFSLAVNGAGFGNGSIVRWKGASRPTTFASASLLRAAISSGDLAAAGAAAVTVFNPAPGGGASAVKTFTIAALNPRPGLAALEPSAAAVGDPELSLTLRGSGFVSASTVRWNGSARTAWFEDGATLRAALTRGDFASSGTVSVSVFNPAPGGGESARRVFTILPRNPAPVVKAVIPETAAAGASGLTLTVLGDNFISSSVVRWNGQDRPTTFLGAQTVRAAISFRDLASTGTAGVTVFNPAPGGGQPRAVSFLIAAPAPAAASLAQARVRPNPWRVDRHAGRAVVIDQIPPGSTVKIFTISAQWVRTLDAGGGQAAWDLTNDSGEGVASGFYIYLATNGKDKKRGLIGVIR